MLKRYPNEHLIAHLFDSHPDSVVWFVPVEDEETGLVLDFESRYCNKAAAKDFHLQPEDLMGERLLSSSVIDTEARGRIFEQCMQVWQSGENMEFTYHSTRLDRYYKVQRSRVQEGVLSIARDCSQEVKSELRRKEQERKFQQLLDASGDGVLLLEAIRDKEDKIIDFYIAFCNRWGHKIGMLPYDAVGKSLFEVLPHLKDHEQLQLHKQVLETGEPLQFETTFRTPDGDEYGWFIVSLTKLGDGVVSRYTDISQRKKYEEKIEEQKEELRSILDSSINAVFACEAVRDVAGRITDFLVIKVNAAFTKICGVAAEKAEGVSFLSLFPEVATTGIFDAYCKVVESGESLRREVRYKGNGIEGWFDISAVKRGGNSIVVSFNDVTPIKEAQLQLENTVEDLRRSNKSLEEFAFAASHDLQEPLRKIQILNDRLKFDFSSQASSNQELMFERIETAAHRMRMLIDNLMSFSNVNQQKGEFELQNLKVVMEDVLHDLETSIEEKGAVITVQELPLVYGNQSQLRQMFQNLISNSLKYSTAGIAPKVTITSTLVKGADFSFLEKTKNAEKQFHLIELKDNGIGFEMQYAKKIFQVFQRLHSSTQFKGTGIGLAIVQKVIENHNGYIFAESQPGEGATFKILLPVN